MPVFCCFLIDNNNNCILFVDFYIFLLEICYNKKIVEFLKNIFREK